MTTSNSCPVCCGVGTTERAGRRSSRWCRANWSNPRPWNTVVILAVLLLSAPCARMAIGDDRAAPTIDTIVSQAMKEAGIEAAPRCTDEVFLRRVTLDLIGRIPTLQEIEQFRRRPDRAACIDRLLASPEFDRFWSECLTTAAIGAGRPFGIDREILRAWYERMLSRDVPYDEMARRLLTAEGNSSLIGPVNFWLRYREDPTTKIARLFLGVRLGCARCHDHPFDRWTREDFDRFSRFFDGIRLEELAERNVVLREALMDAPQEDRPRFLTGARPRGRLWRSELAVYLTHSKPFARAYVNRIWYHLLGRGIVHPVDDFHRNNPPAIAELLEFLRQTAVAQQFRLRPLIRQICRSETYQRSSTGGTAGDEAMRLFARFPLKPLTPGQLYDATHTALGWPIDPAARRNALQRLAARAVDDDFIAMWESRETAEDLLHRLAAPVDVPDHMNLDELFLRALVRSPTPEERKACAGHSAGDVMFALLNSVEFAVNH